MMQEIGWLNIVALFWFLTLWLGYTRFAHYKARRTTSSLSRVMGKLRKEWVRELMHRELRMADAALIANLERNVTFLASSSMLILAGLLTTLVATEKLQMVLVEVPFYIESSSFLLHLKLMVLIIIYVYAFFTFTWSMRQYGFVAVTVGAAPSIAEVKAFPEKAEIYVRSTSKVIDLAAHTYNYGLRAFYFSLSVLAWFINAWLFIFASTLVLIVLYAREFHSRPLKELQRLEPFA
jgi:uncharacterized membrane protein